MAKLDSATIAVKTLATAALEEEEPLLGCWRYHAGGRSRLAPLAVLARAVRDRLGRRPLASPRPGRVVAFAGAPTPAHLGSLVPVLEELQRRGEPAFLVTTAHSRAARPRAPHDGHVAVEELVVALPLGRRVRAVGRAVALARRLATALAPVGCGDAVHWIERGLVVREAVRDWIDPARVALMDGDHHAVRAGFILGAQAAGKTVFSMQHGFLSELQLPILSDRLLCWGESFVEEAAALGVPRSRLVAAGSPRWDHLWSLRAVPRDEGLRRAMARSGEGPLVLVISNSHGARRHPEAYAAFRRGLAQVLAAGLDVALRLHPQEKDLGYYAAGIPPELLERVVVLDGSVEFHQHLRHADVIYHVYSAGALEAMLLGVPVLFSRAPGEQQLCELPEAGAGAWCAEGQAVHLCRQLGQDGEARARLRATQDEYLRRSLAHLGAAAPFVADLLLGAGGGR